VDEQSTIHDRMVYLLQRDYPGSKTVGFRKAVQRLQWDWENWADAEPTEHGESKPTWSDFLEYGEVWKSGIIPDFWFIDEKCMSVVCVEVEDTNPINAAKLNQYIRLWWHLDEIYWETHLLCSDRWGNLAPVPLTNFTNMGLVDTTGHRLASVIEAEREAKEITFQLTKIYAIRDFKERNAEREKWLDKHPGFGLMTNPEFNREAFLHRRGLSV
jgi:hypothetical protein